MNTLCTILLVSCIIIDLIVVMVGPWKKRPNWFWAILFSYNGVAILASTIIIAGEPSRQRDTFIKDMKATYHNSYKFEPRSLFSGVHTVLIADESTYSYNDRTGEQIVYTPHRKVALQIYDHLGSIGVKFSTGLCNSNDSDVVIRWTGLPILPTIY